MDTAMKTPSPLVGEGRGEGETPSRSKDASASGPKAPDWPSNAKAPPDCATTDKIQIKGIPPRPVSFCRECGSPYYPRRDDQEYCAPTCRSKFHKRRYERGAQLYDFAMDWRGKRRKGGFTALCQMVDEWLRDERVRKDTRRLIRDAWKRQQKEG